jgi:hypothetical protein
VTSTLMAAATSPATFGRSPWHLAPLPAPAKSQTPTRPNPMTLSKGWSGPSA